MVIPLFLLALCNASIQSSIDTLKAYVCIHPDVPKDQFSVLYASIDSKNLEDVRNSNGKFCDAPDLKEISLKLCKRYVIPPKNGCIRMSCFQDRPRKKPQKTLENDYCDGHLCYEELVEIPNTESKNMLDLQYARNPRVEQMIVLQDLTLLLIKSILEGAVDRARELIQQGADFTVAFQGKPLIHHAIEREHIKCVELLYDAWMANNQ